MNLYEVTNEYTGESYVRVYVWAIDDKTAMNMAEKKFNDAGYPKTTPLTISYPLMSANDDAFCTEPSDSGWVQK